MPGSTSNLPASARKRGARWLGVGAALALFGLSLPHAAAQQQFQGLCTRVKIQIAQELTLERIGFEATLEVTDNDGNDPITDFFADLTFENPARSTATTTDDSGPLFFVQAPKFESINAVDGTGVIAPTTKAVVRWFIIPKISAGGTNPVGTIYRVGCNLGGKIRGADIPKDVMFAVPATITVRPEPQLQITYFQPRDVLGMDPFTGIGTPIPFTLGVLVKNVGYGMARNVNINSQQPKIVENLQNLILIAQLLGSRVNDSPLQGTSLKVNLGDIPPGGASKGAWDMITSLSGEFVSFSASYTHASDLGGEATSDIQSLNAYFIAHEVLDDQPGRDSIKDFLADTVTNDTEINPNALYESEGNVEPVYPMTNAVVSGSAAPGASIQVQVTATVAGWGYLRIPDPGQDLLPLASVLRSDGKTLNTNNFWTNHRFTRIGNIRQNYLNIFDLVGLQPYTYTVTYGQTIAGTNPPVTTMRFAGSVTQAGGKYFVTPDTQVYFTAVATSPVTTYYSLTNGPFVLAIPFSLPNAGEYPVAFYSSDSFGNREVAQTNVVVVSGSGALDFASVATPAQPIFVSGDALSIRPFNAPLAFQAQPDPSAVNAQIDIFQGVIGWATLAGVPSSPTADTTATLVVGGDHVDYYRYRLNTGAWSADAPVSSPISLSNLTAGAYTVSVLGRSQYGAFLDASNAVSASWSVDPAAPPTRVTGAPATPTRSRQASLNIGGTGVSAYRWTINNDYFRAETDVATALALSLTFSTQQVVTIAVLGKTNGVYQATNNPSTVTWTFDPFFGYAQPALTVVRSVTLTNIGTDPQPFAWDGRGDSGAVMPPGWYTVRLTLQDQLGRTNFTTRLVQVGSFAGAPAVLASTDRGPKNPYARGHWATWQDQSDGNWEIYAQDLSTNPAILKLTNTPLNQENPRTDGRYVVWQGRQTDGSWDLYLKDLASSSPAQPLTSTPAVDEVNPAIDWPWVVYQARPSGNPNQAWLLLATNLITGQNFAVSDSTQDELDPDVQAGRVVWQDLRDVGQGEIYFKNLETGEARRLTTNIFGQYHPAIYDNWVVWQDNRNGQVDIYGFDLLHNAEVAVTRTPENEARPYLDGPWLVCLEDSLGPLTSNVRLIHLPSLSAVPITRTLTLKDRPALAQGKAIWLDTAGSLSSVLAADLPSLQGVFQNRNTVAVTDATASYQQNAFNLLTLWNAQAGVQAVTLYTALVPQVTSETAYWTNGAPAGSNFVLTAGSFLWIKFNARTVVDLGLNNSGPLNLAAGANVFSYARFPSAYSAYRLLNQLGPANARGVRMLDAQSGRWVVAEIVDGRPIGVDFPIPSVAVLMLDLANPVANFQPQ